MPYILVATIPLVPEEIDDLRRAMTRRLPPGQKKIHWSGSVPKFQAELVESIADEHLMHWAVVRNTLPGERPERSRNLALEILFLELSALELVSVVTIESRGAVQDRADRRVLDGLRAKGQVQGIRLEHSPGPSEPMLWISDAVCGIAAMRAVGDPVHAVRLSHQVQWVMGNAA